MKEGVNFSDIEDITETWLKIKTRSIKNTSLYLEWLVLKIFHYFIQEDISKKVLSNMTFNEDGSPKRCAPSRVPDLVVISQKENYVIEVTERPIPGKIEHFSHLKLIEDTYKKQFEGILITSVMIDKVPYESWNTFNNYYRKGNGLFMILDINFLIKLIKKFKKESNIKFAEFIQLYKEIFNKNVDWEIIREKVLILEDSFLN